MGFFKFWIKIVLHQKNMAHITLFVDPIYHPSFAGKVQKGEMSGSFIGNLGLFWVVLGPPIPSPPFNLHSSLCCINCNCRHWKDHSFLCYAFNFPLLILPFNTFTHIHPWPFYFTFRAWKNNDEKIIFLVSLNL